MHLDLAWTGLGSRSDGTPDKAKRKLARSWYCGSRGGLIWAPCDADLYIHHAIKKRLARDCQVHKICGFLISRERKRMCVSWCCLQ